MEEMPLENESEEYREYISKSAKFIKRNAVEPLSPKGERFLIHSSVL